MFMCVELNEGEPTVSLHADLAKISDGLEQRDEICLSAVGNKIADIDGGIEGRCLLNDGFVGQRAALEVDGCRRSSDSASGTRGGGSGCNRSSRGRHGGGTRRGTLGFLVCPVDTNRSGSKPLSVHSSNSLLSVGFVAECKEAVSARFARVHVPHNPCIGHGAKGAEGFGEDIVINFGTEVTNKDVVVTGGVLFVLLALVRPVDANLRVEDLAAIEGLQRSFGSAHVDVLDEAVVEAAMLVVPVRDYFDVLNGPGDGEDFSEHVLGHPRAQISNVKMSTSLGNC